MLFHDIFFQIFLAARSLQILLCFELSEIIRNYRQPLKKQSQNYVKVDFPEKPDKQPFLPSGSVKMLRCNIAENIYNVSSTYRIPGRSRRRRDPTHNFK